MSIKLVEFEINNTKRHGLLLPNKTIKLESGYNISSKGIKIKKVIKEIKSKKTKPKSISQNKNLPKVVIFGCGGTIASKVDYNTGGVFPFLSTEEILSIMPEIKNIANIESKILFNVFSEDMSPKEYIVMGKELEKVLNDDTVKGVVILHGTDTMHYTAAVLSFMIKNLNKPVILVGAQRSSDRPSSDNRMNLLCAIKIAGYANIAEVGICMHGSINDDFCYFHQGTRVRKMHSSRRDTFKSIGVSPFLKINYPSLEIKYLREDITKRSVKKVKVSKRLCSNVGLIKIHPGIKKELILELNKIYKGVIFEGTGFGHVPKNILSTIKKLSIPCFMTTQTIYGRTNHYVYSRGRELSKIGVVYLEDMLPEVALVKLMWVLGRTKEKEKVKSLMKENISGEITRRSLL